jgi:riboflavin kinase/FMN adenylyltransferase
MSEGAYPEALHLLGHEYAIFGTVERGIGLGRKLGYPTANVKHHATKLLPPEGVYACWIQLGSENFCGMMFIGENHFNPAHKVTVEANIFDFDRDIYDQEIIVYPTHYIRGNRRFDSTEALVRQIGIDKNSILEIMKKGETTCP